MRGLPTGWANAPLGDLAELVRGVSYDKATVRDDPAAGYVPVLRATNIGTNLKFDELVFVPSRFVSADQRLRVGDSVLVASSGSRRVVGRAAMVTAPWDGAFGAFCMVLRPGAALLPKFLAFFLQTPAYRQRVSELAAGVNINNLKRQHLTETSIPLAPLAEQGRLVAAIEEHLSRLDAAVAGLKRVQAQLPRYRAAVLKAAVEGRLVVTEAQLERPVGNSDGGDNRHEWRSAQLSSIAQEIRYGHTASAVEWNTGPRFLRITDIQDGQVDWASVPGCEIDPADIPRFLLRDGDIVFTRTGATTGKSYLINDPPRAVFASYLIRVRLKEGVLPDYLYAFFRSPYYWEQIQASKRGIGQPNVNATLLGALDVPVPPLAVQRQIVAELARRLSLTDACEKEVAGALARASRMKRSILARAFAGQLVPQAPNDEPASVLLERIRAARASISRVTETPRRGRRASSGLDRAG